VNNLWTPCISYLDIIRCLWFQLQFWNKLLASHWPPQRARYGLGAERLGYKERVETFASQSSQWFSLLQGTDLDLANAWISGSKAWCTISGIIKKEPSQKFANLSNIRDDIPILFSLITADICRLFRNGNMMSRICPVSHLYVLLSYRVDRKWNFKFHTFVSLMLDNSYVIFNVLGWISWLQAVEFIVRSS
jgi:hypothetical protein